MCPKELSKKHLSEVLILPGPLAHGDDTKITSTFLLGPVDLGDSTKFYNLLWCALGLGGISSEGFNCAS